MGPPRHHAALGTCPGTPTVRCFAAHASPPLQYIPSLSGAAVCSMGQSQHTRSHKYIGCGTLPSVRGTLGEGVVRLRLLLVNFQHFHPEPVPVMPPNPKLLEVEFKEKGPEKKRLALGKLKAKGGLDAQHHRGAARPSAGERGEQYTQVPVHSPDGVRWLAICGRSTRHGDDHRTRTCGTI